MTFGFRGKNSFSCSSTYRLFEIFTEECFPPLFWGRWSDQCPGQFRSRFVNDKLLHIRERIFALLQVVLFMYFESHEGKNLSDTLGGLVKQAYARAVGWTSNVADGLGSDGTAGAVDQLLAIMEQVRARMLAGLTFDNGKVGNFAFFR